MQVIVGIIVVLLVVGLLIFILPLILQGGSVLAPGSGGDAGIYRSTDSADAWEHIVKINNKRNIGNISTLDIAADPQNTNVIFIGTKGNGVFKTVDGGDTWVKIKDLNDVLSANADVYKIAIDPKNSNNIYIASFQKKRGAVLRSKDGGASFEEVYLVSADNQSVLDIAVDYFDSSIIYIGTTQGGAFQSRNFGSSWRILNWFPGVVNNVVLNPKNNLEIFVTTTARGIFKSNDAGNTWEDLFDSLKDYPRAEQVQVLAYDPINTNIIYMGSHYGLLRSVDRGITWKAVNLIVPYESLPVISIAVDHINSKIIYVSAGFQIYKTVDWGERWTVQKLPTTKIISEITIDKKRHEIIYAGIKSIQKSLFP